MTDESNFDPYTSGDPIDLDTMIPGQVRTLVLKVDVLSSVAQGETITNTSYAGSDTVDPDLDDNLATATTDVLAEADLEVVKTDSPDPVIAGTNLVYTIKVTNHGPSDNVGFSVVDAIPSGTSFVSATSPDCADSSPISGTVTCTSAGLVNGASVTWTITVTVDAAVADGTTLSNTAAIDTNNTTDPGPSATGVE